MKLCTDAEIWRRHFFTLSVQVLHIFVFIVIRRRPREYQQHNPQRLPCGDSSSRTTVSTIVHTRSINHVFRPDNLSLGNVPSSYQTYSASPATPAPKLGIDIYLDFLSQTRACLSDMLKIGLSLAPLPPDLIAMRSQLDGSGWKFPDHLGLGESCTTVIYLEDLTETEICFFSYY